MKKNLLFVSMLAACMTATAGDGTQQSPYTVSELLVQKEALATSGDTVWVTANMKGLGEDGNSTSNADTDNTKNMAALFTDGAESSFVAYSWAILGQIELSDLTNTENLLIALTYGTQGHAYGNSASPQYASNYEPTTEHFSIVELRGALSVAITNGLRGYHVPASYIVPEGVIAVKVSAGYSSKNGAYVNYTNFDGNEATIATPKDAALVLMAQDGTYDFTLTSQLYEQTISNGTSLNPGTQPGVNAGTTNNRARFAFVNDGSKAGFERNSDENCTVTLANKSDVFLQVNTLATNFYGNYAWETEAKDWITWGGGQYSDFHEVPTLFDFANNNMELPVGDSQNVNAGDLAGKQVVMGDVTLTVTDGNTATRYFSNNKGTYLNVFKNGTVTLTAADGKAITAVSITFQNSQTGLEANVGTYEAGEWTGNASAVTFTASGARLITAISVTLGEAGTTAIESVESKAVANASAVSCDLNGREAGKDARGFQVIGNKVVFVK